MHYQRHERLSVIVSTAVVMLLSGAIRVGDALTNSMKSSAALGDASLAIVRAEALDVTDWRAVGRDNMAGRADKALTKDLLRLTKCNDMSSKKGRRYNNQNVQTRTPARAAV